MMQEVTSETEEAITEKVGQLNVADELQEAARTNVTQGRS